MANEVKILLTVEGNTVKIQEVSQEITKMGEASGNAFTGGNAAAQTFTNTLLSKLGIIAGLTFAAYKLEQAIVAGFKAGIQAVDEYRLATIGVAATLADLAPQGVSAQQAYSQALVYSKDMYQELEMAAARYFATGKEMVQAWNIMAQKGVALRKDEIDHLGIIVDKVKLLTAGQVSSMQIAQELRAALSGQARATDQLAMLLKDKLGDAWTEVIKKVKEAGSLAPLAEQFQGLMAANPDVQNTLEAQKATLTTLLSQVGRAGLGGAYEDIVDWLKIANVYLTEHRNEIGGGIYRGWIAVKDLVEGTYGFIKNIYTIVSTPIVWTVSIATKIVGPAASWLAQGAGPSGDFGFGALGADYYSQPPPPAPGAEGRFTRLDAIKKTLDMKRAETGAEKFYMLPNGDIVPMSMVEDMPKTGPLAGDKPGGGGKGGAGEDRMLSLEDNLNREIAQLSQGSIAAIDAWYVKTLNDIEKLAGKGADGAEAEALAYQAAGLKKEKVADDFTRLVAKEAGNAYAELDARYNDDLRKYQGLTDAKERLDEMWYKRKADLDDKFAKETLGLEKGYLDALAGASPFLSEQLALKEKSLSIEAQINRAVLEKKLRELEVNHVISAGQADEMRGLAALSEQAKKNAHERAKWETGSIAGGVHIAAFDRGKESETRSARATVEALRSIESAAADALGRGLMAAFKHEKGALNKIGEGMATSFVMGTAKLFTAKLFDPIYKVMNKVVDRVFGKAFEKAIGKAFDWVADKLFGAALDTAAGAVGEAAGQAPQTLATAANTAALIANTAAITGEIAAETISTLAHEAGTAAEIPNTAATVANTIAQWATAIFHSGGVVAHQGLIVAHQGWPAAMAPDERLILAQTGEGILPRSSMAKIGPGRFEALRRGDFEDAPSGSGGGGSRQSISVNVKQQVLQRLDRTEIRRSARDLVRETEREMRRLGRS